MWEHAAKLLNQMENRWKLLDKLECIVDCRKTVKKVLELTSKKGPTAADEETPLMTYVVLRACPQRIYSNISFINMLCESEKMKEFEGNCITLLECVVQKIESLSHKDLNIDEEQFRLNLEEWKEKE